MTREAEKVGKRRTAAATLVCLAVALGALGGERQVSAAGDNEVVVGGTPILRVQVASGGYTKAQRAAAIQARVNQLLGTGPIAASDVTVEPAGNEATVNVKGQLLFTADWATARFNRSTPTNLANVWAGNMRRVLPGLTSPK